MQDSHMLYTSAACVVLVFVCQKVMYELLCALID